jgi:hypothetical protein
MKNDPINFVKNAMVRSASALLTSACTDRTFISARAAQSSHWRVSICRILRSWLVQCVKRRKRLSRLPWVQYLQVRHHIRRWGVHVALTTTLQAGSDTVSIFCQPHTLTDTYNSRLCRPCPFSFLPSSSPHACRNERRQNSIS